MSSNRRERGSATLEAVIAGPAFLLLLALIIVAGRVALAGQAVDAAADQAARTASVARTATQAETTATTAAADTLASQGLHCTTHRVAVDVRSFSAPVGAPARASATVTCTLDLSDLALPGLPGTTTITGTATSPIDTYRARS